MSTSSVQEIAVANFHDLSQNPYPGRGIVAGLDETGRYLVQLYWIMGRSENSRNRVFKADANTGLLCTEAADAAKMKDPSLVIYNAMRERGHFFDTLQYVVSNGDQTDTIIESTGPLYLNHALNGRAYEPDEPNFTQRITAVHTLWKGHPLLQMSILRRSILGAWCDRMLFTYEYFHPGIGHYISTYAGDGDPLPPFRGDPLIMPLIGGARNIAQTYWDALDKANRVSLAVKWIEIGNGRSDIYIINKY